MFSLHNTVSGLITPRDEPHHRGVISVFEDGVAVVGGGAVVGVQGLSKGLSTQPCGEPVLRLRTVDVCGPILTL